MTNVKQFKKLYPARQKWFSFIPTLILVLFFWMVNPIYAHNPDMEQDEDPLSHETMESHGILEIGAQSETSGFASIDEKTGERLPLDTVFLDEHGTEVMLGNIIDRPVILLPAFYTCPRSCSLLISNLALALNQVSLIPGKDFRVITFSFDSDETPADAKQAKANYIPLLPKDFPEKEWVFLTGKSEAILKVTDAMGYHFKKTGVHTFVHPNALAAVSEKGVMIRYVYGPTFLGPDIAMSLTEAAKGNPAISVKRILSFCYNYDPASNRYVFQTLKISAIMIGVLIVAFFLFVLRQKKPKKDRFYSESHPDQGDLKRD